LDLGALPPKKVKAPGNALEGKGKPEGLAPEREAPKGEKFRRKNFRGTFMTIAPHGENVFLRRATREEPESEGGGKRAGE